MAEEARAWIGAPFVWGQCSRAGCDCAGLVLGAHSDAGLGDVRHLRQGQGNVPGLGLVTSLLQTFLDEREGLPEQGDVLLFEVRGLDQHVGIYVGDGEMIHTTLTAGKVICSEVTVSWWQHLLSVWRVRSAREPQCVGDGK